MARICIQNVAFSYEGFDDPAPIGQPERRKRKIQDFTPISCTEYNPKRMYFFFF